MKKMQGPHTRRGFLQRGLAALGLVAAVSSFTGAAFAEIGFPEKEDLKFGFIKLTDMAPLAIAYEKGYFEDEGLYVTLEPCTMCAGALVHARISQLVFGAREPRAGVICSQCSLLDCPWFNHQVRWEGGILAEESSNRLQAFFQERRS